MAKIVDIITPDPHSKIQRQIMEAMITPHLRELYICCGTKFGKSLSAATSLVISAPVKKQSLWRWVGPVYSQAKIGFKYCQKLLPGPPYTRTNRSSMQITVNAPQSSIQFFHGQNPELLEGEAVDGYIIDEAAKQKQEVYSSARTTLTVTQGPMVCISTPVGKNWFYRKCMEAKDHMEWSARKNRPPSQIFLTAPTSANPFVPKASIDFARKQLTENLFRQYYLAEFIDDSAVFSNVEACIYTDLLLTDRCRTTWYADEGLNKIPGRTVIGVDWAKTNDFCVFIAMDVETKRVTGFFRTRSATYRQLVGFLKLFCAKFDQIDMILHDKTGIGAAIDEMLSGINLLYQGIVFNNTNKCEMVSALIVAFQNRWIRIPYWEILVNELKEYEVRTNQIGMMFYSHPAGRHDDTVTALMLAYYAANNQSINFDVFSLDNIPEQKNQIDYEDDPINFGAIDDELYD